MKTYKYILIGVAAIMMAGCNTPFFENGSPSSFTPEEMFSNLTMTEQALAGVYEIFGEDRGYRNRLTCGYAGLNTDIEYNRKSTCDYARYMLQPSNADLSNARGNDPWGYLNTMVERCNNIIEGINKYGYAVCTGHKDSVKYSTFLGEAYFLRGFAMLEMVKYWGDIPVNVKAYDGQSLENATQSRVDRNIAFEQIRKDFKASAELLDWNNSTNDVRRPSRAAALAMLARADLMYAGKAVRPNSIDDRTGYSIRFNLEDPAKRTELYQEVITACDSILMQPTELAKFRNASATKENYASIFRDVCADNTNYAGMEQIWVIPLANGARGQVMNFNCAKFSDKNATNPERYTMGVLLHNKEYSAEVSSNFVMSMVPTLFFPEYGGFEANDLRRDVTILPYRWAVLTRGTLEPKLNPAPLRTQKALMHQFNTDPTQWSCGKYRIEWMSRDNNGIDDGVDFPVIRMADVLLMMAEASIGSNDETTITNPVAANFTGQQCLDMVRARAGLPSTPITLDAIMQERKLEFAGEYIRKWDLMRWGVLKEKMEETHDNILLLAEDGRKFWTKYELDANNTYLQAGAVDFEGKKVTFSYKEVDLVIANAKSGYTEGKPQFEKKLTDADYKLYDYSNPESLNSRQYWPIFNSILGASGGTLVNNYGY